MGSGLPRCRLTAVAEADFGNEPVIAAVNRSTPSRQNRACWGPRRGATQKQVQRLPLPQHAWRIQLHRFFASLRMTIPLEWILEEAAGPSGAKARFFIGYGWHG